MGRVVIVGGVAGGATAAGRIRRLDPDVEIVILEREGYISFANCGMPYYFGGIVPDADDILFETPESFAGKYNIDVKVNNEAIAIDCDNNTVTVYDHIESKEWKLPYDNLILSMGAGPIAPNHKGADLAGVFSLSTYNDMLEIKKYMDTHNPKRVVVVGGGSIGLEVLENFVAIGIEVVLIQRSEHIFPPLDSDIIEQAEKLLLDKGVDFRPNTVIDKIEQDNGLIITTSGGDSFKVDMVITAIGVLPRSEIAKKAGLKTGVKEGIVVNNKMQTNVSNIYAIGDIVQTTNFVSGRPDHIPLAGPAQMQARIAAENICGKDSSYPGSLGSGIIKLFDKTLASTGINSFKAKEAGFNFDSITLTANSHAGYYPEVEEFVIKILYEKPTGRILGAQLMGGKGVDKRTDVIATAIYAGLTVYQLEYLQLSYSPPYSTPRDIANIAAGLIKEKLKKES